MLPEKVVLDTRKTIRALILPRNNVRLSEKSWSSITVFSVLLEGICADYFIAFGDFGCLPADDTVLLLLLM